MLQFWWVLPPAAGYLLGGPGGFIFGFGFNILVWICKLMYDELSSDKKEN
jgi:hypothetical protein